MVIGNMIGGQSMPPKTCVFQDETGTEIHAVLVGRETILTATTNDVREGKTFAGDQGVKTGTKIIPAYHTTAGFQVIPSGSYLTISALKYLNLYDYTDLQAIVCDFNSNLDDSVSATKVSIKNNVYSVNSTDSLSIISKNDNDLTVEFGIINETDKPQIIRFFSYKEIS